MTHKIIFWLASVTLLVSTQSCGEQDSRGFMPDHPRVRVTSLVQQSQTTALLQAVSVVNQDTVWASGHEGTYMLTVDGGLNWTARILPGAEMLEFRDVEAFSGSTAYLLSAGTGDLSRIYRTGDSGDSWSLQFVMDHPEGFLDCMAFWDEQVGIAYGDAVDEELFLLRTIDGGDSWDRIEKSALPDAQVGEGGFAASGTCVATDSHSRGWVATGNGENARVLYTKDRGETWNSSVTPVVGGSSAGLTSLAFMGGGDVLAMGGVIGNDTVLTDNVALSEDHGETWTIAGAPEILGPIYGSSIVPGMPTATVVIVGPDGGDVSLDGGMSWIPITRETYWAVGFASPEAGWLVGPQGRITRFSLTDNR
ncbi:MAG: hypothetical protein MK221_02435 [Gemmatimonadetes bacterium]|nr:hypothetical protein [Gemmatimonadota bacterium]